MFKVYFFSLLLILFTVPFVIFFNKNNKVSLYSLSKDTIYAVIFISFISLLINFFLPINTYVSSSLLFISIVIILFNKSKFLNLVFLKFLLIQGFFITLLILESNVYRPDAGLYHLPYIGILNSEKILLGVSNVHFRYGHTSIIQYFSAISNNFIFGNNGIIFAQALIASSIIINFAYQLFQYNKKKQYNFHFFYIFFIFIFIAYKINRYSEYGNDAPAHLILFFLISEILNSNNKLTNTTIGNQFVLALFVLLNKLTLIFVVFLPLINIRKIKIFELIFNRRFIFTFIFFWLWIIKNLLTTGCAIYPVKTTCYDQIIWTDINEINRVSVTSEAWAKGWSNKDSDTQISQKEFINNFNWLETWSKVHLKHIIKILLPYILFITFIIFLIRFDCKKNLNFHINKINLYYFVIITFGLIFWFIKSPLYRYGYSYIVIFISFIFSFYIVRFNICKNYQKIIFSTILILSLSVIIIKNIHRIVLNDNDYFNHPWPKFYSMESDNVISKFKKIKLGDKYILYPVDGYCMYVNGFCSHYKIKDELKVKKYKDYDIFYYNFLNKNN